MSSTSGSFDQFDDDVNTGREHAARVVPRRSRAPFCDEREVELAGQATRSYPSATDTIGIDSTTRSGPPNRTKVPLRMFFRPSAKRKSRFSRQFRISIRPGFVSSVQDQTLEWLSRTAGKSIDGGTLSTFGGGGKQNYEFAAAML
jgi:hypothetical protein